MCQSCCNSMWSSLSLWLISWFACPMGQNYSVPDGGCPECTWWHHVSPCFLSCHALYNPQEEDSVPPRPPLPQSYEPNPPTVPPMPSHAGVRPSSLHRPEDRKANHRNGTHSVSLLTRWPHGWPCPQLCHHTSLLAVMVFAIILMDISCLLGYFWLDCTPLFTWRHISLIFFSGSWMKPCLCFFSPLFFNWIALPSFSMSVSVCWKVMVLFCCVLSMVANYEVSEL